MEIKERVYTLISIGGGLTELLRDGLPLECPFSNPPADYVKVRCGEWCPAFIIEPAHTETAWDTHTGLMAGEIEVPTRVVLKCFSQPVEFVIKEDQDEPTAQD